MVLTGLMRFRCIWLSSHRLIMDRSRKWPDLRSKMTWQTSHQVQPSLLHLHWHYSNDQCQLRRQWNAGQPNMNLIAVSARLQVIASFWKNKINFDKMTPEMQQQCPQHRIRISIIGPKSSIIHKKGDKSVAGNYRPVSLTSLVCKVLESIIKYKIVDFLSENELINDTQHGFRKGRSC